MSDNDKKIIKNVKRIAFAGANMSRGDQFYPKGITGAVSKAIKEHESVEVQTETFFYAYHSTADNPTYTASIIAHEGNHIDDYQKSIGAYHPNLSRQSLKKYYADVNEYRASSYQIKVFNKIMDTSKTAMPTNNHLLKYLEGVRDGHKKKIPRLFIEN